VRPRNFCSSLRPLWLCVRTSYHAKISKFRKARASRISNNWPPAQAGDSDLCIPEFLSLKATKIIAWGEASGTPGSELPTGSLPEGEQQNVRLDLRPRNPILPASLPCEVCFVQIIRRAWCPIHARGKLGKTTATSDKVFKDPNTRKINSQYPQTTVIICKGKDSVAQIARFVKLFFDFFKGQATACSIAALSSGYLNSNPASSRRLGSTFVLASSRASPISPKTIITANSGSGRNVGR